MSDKLDYCLAFERETRKAQENIFFFAEILQKCTKIIEIKKSSIENLMKDTNHEDQHLAFQTITALSDILIMFNNQVDAAVYEFNEGLTGISSRNNKIIQCATSSLLSNSTSLETLYKVGHVSTCELMNVKDSDNGICYIADIDSNWSPSQNLIEFWKMPISTFKEMPYPLKPGDMFGLEVNRQICRAVVHSQEATTYRICLIDTGEMIDVDANGGCKKFAISSAVKNTPPCAILCKIVKVYGGSVFSLSKLLEKKNFKFQVVRSCVGDVLHIELFSTNPFEYDINDNEASFCPIPAQTDSISLPEEQPVSLRKTSKIERISTGTILSEVSNTESLNNQFATNGSNYGQNVFSNIHESEQLEAEYQTINTVPRGVHSMPNNPYELTRKSTVNQLSRQNLNNKPLSRSSLNLLLYGETNCPARAQNLHNLQEDHPSNASQLDSPPKPISNAEMDMNDRQLHTILNSTEPITLYPTSIVNVTDFFANVTHSIRFKEFNQQLCSDLEKKKLFHCSKMPSHSDHVLAVLEVGRIVRAKVINIVHQRTVEVFCLDNGNSEFVHIENIYCWEPYCSDIPFQAIFCRIFNIKPKTGPNRKTRGVTYLSEKIKNKFVNAEIKARSKDPLLVQLIDDYGYDIGEEMCALELVDPNYPSN